MYNILKVLGLSCVSGLLMYFGGEGHKQIKRIGIPLTTLFTMWFLGMDMQWYYWLLTAGLSYFAMTTYWSTVSEPDDDVEGLEWALTGLTYGVALFPYAFASGHFFGWGIRTVALSLIIWLWSIKFGNVFVEGFGRGFFIVASLPILLL